MGEVVLLLLRRVPCPGCLTAIRTCRDSGILRRSPILNLPLDAAGADAQAAVQREAVVLRGVLQEALLLPVDLLPQPLVGVVERLRDLAAMQAPATALSILPTERSRINLKHARSSRTSS